jgi:guanine deaminase
MEIIRAHILHAPDGRAVSLPDGAIAFAGGAIAAVDAWDTLHATYPDAAVHDFSDSYLLPGLIDVHVHYPQTGVIGAMGKPLLAWLRERTLPAEAALNTPERAAAAAREFLAILARNGTTSALVFGSHLAVAQEAFFAEAVKSGLRIVSGLSLGDRELPEPLLSTPEQCYRTSEELLTRWHNHESGMVRYAVTPRFSVSCSDAVLEACGALKRAYPDIMVQSHINENVDEVALVRRQFPDARDYFDTYERAGLAGPGTVLAHNLHFGAEELLRIAGSGTAIAHCPSSNAFLGSGTFPMAAHETAGVPFAIATDVGGGTGFSLFKEALAAYEMQRLRPDGVNLTPGALLHLVTGAAARILGVGETVGRLESGYSADFVAVRPARGGTLSAVLSRGGSGGNGDAEDLLGAIITLAREDAVAATWVRGTTVWKREEERQ